MKNKLLLLMVFFSINLPAFACSCIYGELADFVANADLVFLGKVESIENDSQNSILNSTKAAKTNNNQSQKLVANFKIMTKFKGDVIGEKVSIKYTASDGGNCGWNFESSQTGFVIANFDNGQYRTNSCLMSSIDYFGKNQFQTELLNYISCD